MAGRRLYQTAAEQLAALIDSGQFAPGTRLPGERELSQRLGVSRATIREAEVALQATGRLQIRTGAGVYVNDQPAVGSGLAEPDLLELLEARLVLEGEAAALAARRIESDELERIDQLVAVLGGGGAERDAEAVREIHSNVVLASRNPALCGAITALWLQQDALPRWEDAPRPEEKCASERRRDYQSLMQALRGQDVRQARDVTRRVLHGQLNLAIEAEERRSLAETRQRIDETRRRFWPAYPKMPNKLAL